LLSEGLFDEISVYSLAQADRTIFCHLHVPKVLKTDESSNQNTQAVAFLLELRPIAEGFRYLRCTRKTL